MLEIRKLEYTDSPELELLIAQIESTIACSTWWLPIVAEARANFFNDEWTIFLGAYADGKLVAASALFLDKFEYGESASHLKIHHDNIAEIGRCMVAPEFRGQNLMYQLNVRLLEYAHDRCIQTLIATAHPDNIASNRSLLKLGMKYECTIAKREKYLRNIYSMEI